MQVHERLMHSECTTILANTILAVFYVLIRVRSLQSADLFVAVDLSEGLQTDIFSTYYKRKTSAKIDFNPTVLQ
jgi:hypothetical protein